VKTDPAHNFWKKEPGPLDLFFNPKTIAVIGATEKAGSVGRTIFSNLAQNSFKGRVFPVNPGRSSVLGVSCCPNIAAIGEKIDLAVIVTPAVTVPDIVSECAAAGVKAAIVISAGFKELGAPGIALEKKILERAQNNLRIIGPNCLGLMNPRAKLNATFANKMALPGHVGFISQSGALCTAVLDWSFREHVGFSAFVSVGSMLDVGWGDLIDHLGDDPDTTSILIYMESIGDARAFLSAAREVALTKPIIVLKAGRTQAAAKAAVSHTGSIAGSDEVLEAAFRRAGVLRVNEIGELFDMAEILAKQPKPKGPRLSIVTNAGGPGVLATDALITAGGALSELSKQTIQNLNSFLPEHWSHANPVDILGDADPQRYAKTLEIVAKDPQADGFLVILTPQAMTDPLKTAEELKSYAAIPDKPVLASWMGGPDVGKAREVLTKAGIPVFAYPDEAARLFEYMWQYSFNLKSIYQTPELPLRFSRKGKSALEEAEKIIARARESQRAFLTEEESKKLLSAYGIPVVETCVAVKESEAVKAAARLGYPVALKLHSEIITHKTDVGGVCLNLKNSSEVKNAFRRIEQSVRKHSKDPKAFLGVTVQPMVKLEGACELIIGSSCDAQFGPVIVFGAGGQLVEIFKDHALALPPLTTTLARRLMERTRIFEALQGVRGQKSVDLSMLDEILVRFSQLVAEQPLIREIDINPFLASSRGLVALDARVVLHPLSVSVSQAPRLAIRPYPADYVSVWTLKDGGKVRIRPIRPEDEPLMVGFHKTLSEQSIRRRYFRSIGLDERIAHERLARVCFNDYDREIALVVDRQNPKDKQYEILAVARLRRLHGSADAEFSTVIADAFQNQGLGARLLTLMLEIGKKEKLNRMIARMLKDNWQMRKICEGLGFVFAAEEGDVVRAEFVVRS
jgi:acetyltransferase